MLIVGQCRSMLHFDTSIANQACPTPISDQLTPHTTYRPSHYHNLRTLPKQSRPIGYHAIPSPHLSVSSSMTLSVSHSSNASSQGILFPPRRISSCNVVTGVGLFYVSIATACVFCASSPSLGTSSLTDNSNMISSTFLT